MTAVMRRRKDSEIGGIRKKREEVDTREREKET
jgi:hypothetical protein